MTSAPSSPTTADPPPTLLSPVKPSPPSTTVQLAEAMDWKSVVRSHKLGLEYAAIDIDTYRVLYHMEMELATPLPPGSGLPGQWLCLTWPYGGLWKIERVTDNNTKVKCLSWRKTEMKESEMETLAKSADALAKKAEAGHEVEAPKPITVGGMELVTGVDKVKDDNVAVVDETPDLYPTLFEWKMMIGEWESDVTHWFIRDVEPPINEHETNLKRKLIATLFVGFDPLEASIEVNAVTAMDTVEQTYAADVTWQVMFPAITALREDSVLHEFLDLLDINANQFEFSNVAEMTDQRELTSSLIPAGDAQFRDVTLVDDRAIVEDVYHLTFRRRVCASFTTEMALHNFPFDQQKLLFEFTTGSGMPNSSVFLVPSPVEPGSFSVENFQLGNVFHVLYHQKIFVSEIQESGPKKFITFEMVLQRRSPYYLTNVAMIAAIIAYLCFVTFAPDATGATMDMGSRLQVVSALVLTAVTFKNQVAAVIPQVSYFTMLDKYVVFCFVVAALVMVENALFPSLSVHIGVESDKNLLYIATALFTVINIGWTIYILHWLDRRYKTADTLMQVHAYIREISENIPTKYRSDVLHQFLASKRYEDWRVPTFITTSTGDIHIQAPDDVPPENVAQRVKRAEKLEMQKQEARNEVAQFKKIYFGMRPGLDRRASAPTSGPATLPRTGAGRLSTPPGVKQQGNQSYGSTARSTSQNTYFHANATAINVDSSETTHVGPYRRHRGGSNSAAIRVDPFRRQRQSDKKWSGRSSARYTAV